MWRQLDPGSDTVSVEIDGQLYAVPYGISLAAALLYLDLLPTRCSDVAATPRDEIEGVLIPGEALRADERGDFVWLVNNGVVARRGVEVGGDTERAEILIVNGLRIGDTIVRSSERPLAGGQSIKTN